MAQQRKLLAAISLAFVAMGMALGSFGPALADLARQAQSSLESAGVALTALGIGIVVGQALGTLSLKPFGHRVVLLIGMLLFLMGVVGIITSFSLIIFVTAAALGGIGMGFMALGVNVIAAEALEGASALNFVNAMFGVGAIISPALVAASIRITETAILALWAAPIVMLMSVATTLFWVPSRISQTTNEMPQNSTDQSVIAMLSIPFVWLIGAFLFTINAIEAGMSGWASTILQQATKIDAASGALAASLYWLMITLARFAAAWASKHSTPETILQLCIGTLSIGGILFVGSAVFVSPLLGIIAAAILGLSAGPVLPTALALARKIFPESSGTVTGCVIVMGNIGGACSSLALGFLLFRFGTPAATSLFYALSLTAAALLYTIISKLNKDYR